SDGAGRRRPAAAVAPRAEGDQLGCVVDFLRGSGRRAHAMPINPGVIPAPRRAPTPRGPPPRSMPRTSYNIYIYIYIYLNIIIFLIEGYGLLGNPGVHQVERRDR